MKKTMKTPITYYGGKQRLSTLILKLIPPDHDSYIEPFAGGLAVFFAKEKSATETINDTNREVVNFYQIVKNDFISLEKEIKISLHSRSLHSDATVIYNNPHLFSELKRAWAFWVLANQSFAGIVGGSWNYEKHNSKRVVCLQNKRESFTEDYAIRLQNVQIECADAVYVINSRDHEKAFHYLDPPYFNADMGHYGGYKKEDFEKLLCTISNIKGRFLLSSYRSDVLTKYTKENNWHTIEKEMSLSVGTTQKGAKRGRKIEVLTANYPISLN